MPRFSPFWLEAAITTGVLTPFAIAAICFQFRIELQLVRSEANGKLQDYLLSNWKRVLLGATIGSLIAAPVGEEVIYRALPVLLCRPKGLWWALAVGLLLNIVFALTHRGMPEGIFTIRWHHQAMAFVVGFFLLSSALASGMLIVPIALHMFINLSIGGGLSDVRTLLKGDSKEGMAILERQRGFKYKFET